MTLRRTGQLPLPPRWRVAARGAAWSAALCGFAVALAWDSARGLRSPAGVGRRLRRLFERVGGTAVKLGQQLSVRADILPEAVCAELAALADRVPPIPCDQVRGLVEAELGRPLDQVFRRFDPHPIGSASVACVYAAELADGRRVAVKLRRPGVIAQFAADLAVLELVLRGLELATVFRDGTFAHLRRDLRTMLGEETSFRLEARFQRLFRLEVRRAGMPWITAPEVIGALSTDALLVTRFVDGLPMTRVLAARESGPPSALAAAGVDVGVLARRLARFSLWARFEATFFHADPHPGNVFVLPGDRLVLIDFGGCGVTSARTRRNHTEIMRQTLRGDRSMVARIAVSDLSPLPRLDADAFLADTEQAFADLMLAMNDRNAHWSERIVVAVWLRLLEVTRRYQIRVNLDTVRSIRAFLLYDTLAARLDPGMGFGTSRRYLREWTRRNARRAARADRAGWTDQLGALVTAVDAAAPAVEAARITFQRLARARVIAARGGLHVVQVGVGAVALASAARIAGCMDEARLGWLIAAAGAWIAGIAAVTTRRGLHALGRVRPGAA